jgi:RNA polymerase sigma-70 factor (ECF subfamily)
MENWEFDQFLSALRAGDDQAAAELVRRYEPLLRRVVRMRLTDPRLRRAFDSLDVCQSVLAHFFAEVDALDVNTEGHLRKLLVRMASNKLIDKVRREAHHAGGLPAEWEPAAASPSPSQVVAQQDLLEAIQRQLSARERWLAEQRALGKSWVELARQTGETTDALRMTHARALARVRILFQARDVSDAP